ncbi:MAG: hypothetical protein Q3965_05490, partial [Rothia sp. (in: high G+C Gram-positive bacteria)]|nr:hypothetical protein [Rothia sp. (in: high G+C Gram-positive bacteria)]
MVKTRLVTSYALITLTAWMTFSATMLHLNASSGPQAVTFYLFLITMTPALCARWTLSKLSYLPVGKIWAWGLTAQVFTLALMLPFATHQAAVLAGLGLMAVWQNISSSSFT